MLVTKAIAFGERAVAVKNTVVLYWLSPSVELSASIIVPPTEVRSRKKSVVRDSVQQQHFA